MKFINEIEAQNGNRLMITSRIARTRFHKKTNFLDLEDHTGTLQVVFSPALIDEPTLKKLRPGSYITVEGVYDDAREELRADKITIESASTLPMYPSPWEIDGTAPEHIAQVFGNTGYYVANPQRAAVLKIKTNFVNALHDYFQENKFTLVEPPILTNKTLYTNDNAVVAQAQGEEVYLSQCATFELEPLAMAFGKVYTISPAFRNESEGSRRHLTEYSHAKAELLFADIEDLIKLAGESFYSAVKKTVETSSHELEILGKTIDVEQANPKNYARMTYDEAIKIVQSKGSQTQYGEGLKTSDEKILTAHAGDNYLWVMYLPFESEGFPYKRKKDAPHLSMTCDLIAPHGAGEMIGVAEKTDDAEELIENLVAKGKQHEIRDYWSYILLRMQGLPKHGGIGAAPERMIYGLLDLDHIRLTKPWPRYPGRRIHSVIEELNPWKDKKVAELMKKYSLVPEAQMAERAAVNREEPRD